MNNRYHLLLVLIIALWTFSCEKEKIVERVIDRTTKWTTSDQFLFSDKIKMNSFSDSDNAYLIGPENITKLIPNGDSNLVEHARLNFFYPLQYRLPIATDVFVGLGASSIGFFSTQNPVFGNHFLWVNLLDLDPDFALFEFPPYQISTAPVINQNNQCIVPYFNYDTTEDGIRIIEGVAKFALFDLTIEDLGGNDHIDTSQVRLVDGPENIGPIISLHTVGDNFFVTGLNQTFRLDNQLTWEIAVEERLYKIFEYQNTLYAFSGQNFLYQADLSGNNWNKLGSVDNDFQLLNYGIINDQLIGYFNSQLFEIEIDSENINAREIENDGLFGHEITSVMEFNGTVYVSTLSGVFTRSIGSFFEYKE